jgi:hypothetical protein
VVGYEKNGAIVPFGISQASPKEIQAPLGICYRSVCELTQQIAVGILSDSFAALKIDRLCNRSYSSLVYVSASTRTQNSKLHSSRLERGLQHFNGCAEDSRGAHPKRIDAVHFPVERLG